MITPTDRAEQSDDHRSGTFAEGPYYELTHDYLVHSLREWLTRKQRESRTGRAELCLAERAALDGPFRKPPASVAGRVVPDPLGNHVKELE